VATYQIEITTDSSVGSSLPPQFSLSGNEEYLAEYDFVQAEADEKELRDSVIKYYEVMRKDNAVDNMTKTDSVGVESAPVTERKKEFFVDPLARFSSSRCRKLTCGTIQALTKKSSFDGIEVPVKPLTRFSPFRKKNPSEASVSSGSEHIPKKTETMSYDAPILLARTGTKSFLYLSVSPATNSILNPISK
jgi:hypothetical protein